jgi:Nuclease-related domain
MEIPRSRSPLKLKPLRLPGQSLDEAIDTLFWDELGPPFLFAFILAVLAGFEWLTALTRVPPQPWLFTGFAVAASLYAARKFAKLRGQFRRMVLGRDGERVVAEELEKLRADGAEVIHDVPAPGFNIDHVVLSRRGFYAIETKTWSKPQTGDARIHLTETGIVANGRRPSRDPIAQVEAAAKWLTRFLEDSSTKRFAVRGTVLFPGWFIERMSPAWRQTPGRPWVLEPKALAAFIEREPQDITEDELRRAASSLKQYVRNANAHIGPL